MANMLSIMINKNNEKKIEKNPPKLFKVSKCISKESHINLAHSSLNAYIDNAFSIFKSIDNKYFLIFSHTPDYINYSLIIYDLIYQQIIIKRFNAHEDRIYTCRHYFYEKNKNDLLITSSFDKFIKIWNITQNFSLMYKLKPDYDYKTNTYLLAENLLFYQNLFIITSAYEINSDGYEILFYDISKNSFQRKEIELINSKDNTNYLDVYYEKDTPNILAGNYENIKIFDFPKKKLIKKFHDNHKKINYYSVIIKENEILNKKTLIATGADGILRIWDYSNSNLLHKLEDKIIKCVGLCLLNKQFILAASTEGNILEYDLYSNKLVEEFNRNNNKNYDDNDFNNYKFDPLFSIKKFEINEKQYLVTHSHQGFIELWEKEE